MRGGKTQIASYGRGTASKVVAAFRGEALQSLDFEPSHCRSHLYSTAIPFACKDGVHFLRIPFAFTAEGTLLPVTFFGDTSLSGKLFEGTSRASGERRENRPV